MDSSHRHDWFEKLDQARERTETDFEASATPVNAQVVEDEVVELRHGTSSSVCDFITSSVDQKLLMIHSLSPPLNLSL